MDRISIWYIGKKRRFAFIGLAAAAFVMLYLAGTYSQISEEEAGALQKMFMEETKDLDGPTIFVHNFTIAAAMFIPAAGVVVGLVSAYSTGLVFKALVETMPGLAGASPLLILATPFGLMEMFSYGMAMSQSVLLINAIMRRQNLRPLLLATAVQIGIVAAILLASGLIEFYMIQAITPPTGLQGIA